MADQSERHVRTSEMQKYDTAISHSSPFRRTWRPSIRARPPPNLGCERPSRDMRTSSLLARAVQHESEHGRRQARAKRRRVERRTPTEACNSCRNNERHKRCSGVLAGGEERVPRSARGRVGKPGKEDVCNRWPAEGLGESVRTPKKYHQRERRRGANREVDGARCEQRRNKQMLGRNHVYEHAVEQRARAVDDLKGRSQHSRLALARAKIGEYGGQPEAVVLACHEHRHVRTVDERELSPSPARGVEDGLWPWLVEKLLLPVPPQRWRRAGAHLTVWGLLQLRARVLWRGVWRG
eukprot:scaffold77907_cov30-Tisochrysis_lutea.AAC.4